MTHPVDIHVGGRLKQRRKLLGLSQEALGNVVGVTFQQIQKYERGTNRISSSMLYEFSRALKSPVHYFFEGMEALASGVAENKADGFEHEEIASRETLELVRSYSRITSPELRKKVLDFVKSLGKAA